MKIMKTIVLTQEELDIVADYLQFGVDTCQEAIKNLDDPKDIQDCEVQISALNYILVQLGKGKKELPK